MKKICFISCETNGLHSVSKQTKEVKSSNINKWANLLAVYYYIGHYDGKEIVKDKNKTLYVDPSFEINKDAIKIHGLTKDFLSENGLPLEEVLSKIKKDLSDVKFICGHNLDFHLKAIQAECFRTKETLIHFNNNDLIDLMTFKHGFEYPSIIKLKSEFLKKSYSDKSRKFVVIIYKKLFEKLYKKFNLEYSDNEKESNISKPKTKTKKEKKVVDDDFSD